MIRPAAFLRTHGLRMFLAAALAAPLSHPVLADEAAGAASMTTAAERNTAVVPPPYGFVRLQSKEVIGKPALAVFLAKLKKEGEANRFCFVREKVAPDENRPGGAQWVWMIWHEGGRIYQLGDQLPPPGTDPEEVGTWLRLRKSINLATDVVATADDIRGSSSLVDRAWVERLQTQCRQHGTEVKLAAARDRSAK